MALQNLFVPRARIATFEVALRIEDLNNVPPLNGMFYAKWRCQTHSGTSSRVPVANQQVQWSHAVRRTVDIPVGRDGVLAPCELRIAIRQLSISISQTGGPDDYDVPPLDRSMVLTDLNDIVTSESSVRPRDAASGGNSLSSTHPSRRTAHLSSSSHSTGRSATTETSHSRGLLPIDNTNIRELAPFQRSSRKNQQIVDDIFSLSL
ncbi:hypothetical protein EV183_002546 [Coemansia sp. RSA 2336]|nr:hypothetical protein EV183_002546 [Coemansia sp. RSA 2336]